MLPERPDSRPANSTRSYSISSEVPSLPGHALLAPPASINPEPAYIAVSAASQLVSSELEIDGVTISASALAQLNSFLDNILFNILLAAKSTKLSLLRPAIYNVLKPKLGRPALSGADEELREYLGDDEDEDENLETTLDRESKREFDLELAWKLARLRCMVYSRLGDLEEDDEDEYIERDNLDERGGRPRRFSNHPSRVTTAAAIFLTSIVEFLAEQALAHAAQATQRKLSKSRASQGTLDSTPSLFFPPDRVVVSDADMRHLGRDSPLQKLWRGWRHQARMPTDPASRSMSPESLMMPGHSRKASFGTSDGLQESGMQYQRPVAKALHRNDPASIPLPITNNDIDEIEVPGLRSAREVEETSTASAGGDGSARRPRSLQRSPSGAIPPVPISVDDKMIPSSTTTTRPVIQQRRSRSLPTSPSLTPRATSSHISGHYTGASGPPVEDMEGGHDPSNGVFQQPPTKSYSPTGGEVEPAADSTTPIAMPGSFPRGLNPNRAAGVKQKDTPTTHEVGVLPRALGASTTETTLDRREAPMSSPTLSTYNSPALEPALPIRPHPPRTSSKAPSEYDPYYQQDPPARLGSTTPVSKAATGHSVTLPLAPLQEMTESARPTPGQTFPGTPITDAQKRQGQVIFPPETREIKSRTSSKSSHHTNGSSSSSKLLGFDREQQSAMQSGSDRAGVQRIYPVPGVPDTGGQATRPNTSHSSKERRPGTSSSHMSSLKQGSLGRSSLDTAIGNSRGQKQSMEQDEKEQSLENLIRSEETLKYTLTPQSMREMETPESPRQKTQTQDLADFFRSTVPPGPATADQAVKKPRSPVDGINGLRANPPQPITIPPRTPASVEVVRSGRVEQQSPASPAAKSVRSQHQPRDPKIQKSSTGDLADFAKSTGPEGPGQLPKVVSTMSSQPRRANSFAPRFQARDPVVKGANSDLIDFIREGPPRAKGDGTHRISRTVAPFRTTMDSDELNALGPSQDLAGRNSGSSNQDGSVLTKSTVNSRTGLMDSTKRTAFNPSNSSNLGASQVSKRNAGEATQPKRKQKRVRDPYAIDVGSDDEIDDGLGKPPKYEEESLIDFLRNTSPPPESQFQPQPLLFSASQTGTHAHNVLRKPVNGGFRERLKRTASTNSLGRSGGGKPSLGPSDTAHTSVRSGPQVRPTSPHLVQSGSRFDIYKPTQTTYAAHVDRSRHKVVAPGLDDGRDDGSLTRFFSRKRRVAA